MQPRQLIAYCHSVFDCVHIGTGLTQQVTVPQLLCTSRALLLLHCSLSRAAKHSNDIIGGQGSCHTDETAAAVAATLMAVCAALSAHGPWSPDACNRSTVMVGTTCTAQCGTDSDGNVYGGTGYKFRCIMAMSNGGQWIDLNPGGCVKCRYRCSCCAAAERAMCAAMPCLSQAHVGSTQICVQCKVGHPTACNVYRAEACILSATRCCQLHFRLTAACSMCHLNSNTRKRLNALLLLYPCQRVRLQAASLYLDTALGLAPDVMQCLSQVGPLARPSVTLMLAM
jgi:hypothetical protein